MGDPFFDLFDNILKYNDNEAIIIVDEKVDVWFSGSDIAKMLGYSRPNMAIRKHVPPANKRDLSQLIKHIITIPHNAQMNTVYINEGGLYKLIFSSKLETATQFTDWITNTVIPSIRKTGYFIMSEKHKNELAEVNKKLEESENTIKTISDELKRMKNNEVKHSRKKGNFVYAVRSLNSNESYIRIGRTINLGNRMDVYNTTSPDNFELLYYLDVFDNKCVEKCIQGVLFPSKKRNNRDYYESSLDKIKEVFIYCANNIDQICRCAICDVDVTVDQLIKHSKEVHNIKPGDDLIVDLSKKIIGETTINSVEEIANNAGKCNIDTQSRLSPEENIEIDHDLLANVDWSDDDNFTPEQYEGKIIDDNFIQGQYGGKATFFTTNPECPNRVDPTWNTDYFYPLRTEKMIFN